MCEINGLSELWKGWAGTLKDTPNEAALLSAEIQQTGTFYSSFYHCPSFSFLKIAVKDKQKFNKLSVSFGEKFYCQSPISLK